MQLKRGLERKSCDFCYRRKIKCDRWARGRERHGECSQCALRQVSCSLDDSDDIRIRNRRQDKARDAASDSRSQQQQHIASDVSDGGQQPPSLGLLDGDSYSTSTGQLDLSPYENGTMPLLDGSVPVELPPALDVGTVHHNSTDNPPTWESLFELSSDSISFLDQIFMWDNDLLERTSRQLTPTDQIQASAADDLSGPAQKQLESMFVPGRADDGHHQTPCRIANIEATMFDTALHAYFDWANLYLPVLIEDAFWQDYTAGHCSVALALAVACRGIPFTAAEKKWQLQQQLACKFREVFLKSQHQAGTQGEPRLDDLEALALMVDFGYDHAHSPPIDSRLGDLFLTIDSLVLMTLQAHTHSSISQSPASWTSLAKSDERRRLLFWHVYALDAFHSLDCKVMSRIQDDVIEIDEKQSLLLVGGYFDAILALAIVARRVVHVLCCNRVRQRGVRFDELQSLYRSLQHWHANACPSHLRWPTEEDSDIGLMDGDESSLPIKPGKIMQLRRSVVASLERNCYMQIESCVVRYGIRDRATLEGEMVAVCLEYETLRAVKDIIALSQCSMRSRVRDQDSGSHSLVDLATPILRNTCAGVCTWLCLRGKARCRRGLLNGPSSAFTSGRTGTENEEEHMEFLRIVHYTEVATTLRHAVATAISHEDTEQMVAHLDQQVDSLKQSVHDYRFSRGAQSRVASNQI